jgi:hypothetical protein
MYLANFLSQNSPIDFTDEPNIVWSLRMDGDGRKLFTYATIASTCT